ncbi:aspartic peptidase domain-containing protein [Cercophora newfieldiana]|uniref:Aspartic peptidase domain-containing protein n=1 Tax=Cercophora newfieldiana TaxID=92897 RepID=A0AA39YFZ4_9PEZI|nr:aspartic peptidase domain-containing protein [Cercophora newfieldiana]
MAKGLANVVAVGLLLNLALARPYSDSGSESDVPETIHVAKLTRRIPPEPGNHMRRLAAPIGTAKALPVSHPAEYLAEVRAGGYRYALQIDTGSSDTWFVKDGFQCLLYPHCNLGPVFRGDFPGGQIEIEHLNISYGGDLGAFLNGQMGYSDLTVAGVTIPKQQIALATLGAWTGDGISSGILGLGLPGLTGSFKGKTPAEDGLQNLVNYSPVVTTVTNQIGKHIFSLGLSRNESESFLALGGVPQNIKVGNYTRVPIEKMAKSFGGSDYFYYALTPETIVWKNSTNQTEQKSRLPQVIVDSGTTLNVLPYDIALSINNHFEPPATYLKSQGGWFVPCNAKPPRLGIQIGGQMFWTDPSSMILPQVMDPDTGYCATGIGSMDGPVFILGDVFMQGLVAVFDVGQRMEMRFAKRLV